MREGWKREVLDAACEIAYGTRVTKKQDAGTAYPVYGGGGETFRLDRFNREDCTIVARFGMSESCVRHVAGKFFLNDSGLSLAPKDPNRLIPRFLDYFLYASQTAIYRLGRGSAQKNLDVKAFRQLELCYPESLPEQKRIVAILDEAFTGIATAVANTEKNLANARELFESFLNSVVGQKREGWRETNLGREIDLQTGFAFKSKGYSTATNGIRLLRGDNIVPGAIRWNDHKKWSRDDAEGYSRYQLKASDIVLAMDRTWIKSGLKYAQVKTADLPCLLVQRVARLRAGPRLNNEFLRFLIESTNFTNYVLSIQTGLGVPHISGPQISAFEFFLPPVCEQAEITATLEDMKSSVERLVSNYQQKQSALSELKQTLLRKAFSGELTAVPQDEIETAVA